ncbi:MAG: phage tail protein [gamma proteobacterium symbiont of Taylorina sp.]|nr:phage tail protein [gamma proteobacterium symbiont of Taylorina sp.]
MGKIIEIKGLEEVQAMIKDMPRIAKMTIATSINRTATHAKSVTSQTVRTFTTVKASYAKASMKIPSKASMNKLNSKLVITGERIPLIGYQTSKTKKGIKARIFKFGALTLRPHSFYAIMKSGHKGVFWRDKKADGSLVGRLGITELKDLSVPELVDDNRVWDDLQEDASETLDKELAKNLAYYMDKYK